MIKITELKILEEYTNNLNIYGLYWCKIDGYYKLFSRNNDTFKVLTHFFERDELNEIRDDVTNELFKKIKLVRKRGE